MIVRCWTNDALRGFCRFIRRDGTSRRSLSFRNGWAEGERERRPSAAVSNPLRDTAHLPHCPKSASRVRVDWMSPEYSFGARPLLAIIVRCRALRVCSVAS